MTAPLVTVHPSWGNGASSTSPGLPGGNMAAMGTSPRHARLSRSGQWWLAIAVTFAIAGMLAGFWFSFFNLRDAAAAHGWPSPWALPLMIDLGIPAYVIIDHLIVSLGWRSRLARCAAWGFAALTIALNGAVAQDASPLWRITAAAMPAVWVLGIETLRLLWRVLRKDPAAAPDSIPAGRWFASPVPTFFLWRRAKLHNVTSYAVMAARENARQRARDRIRAAAEADPPRSAPASLRRAVRSGRLPAAVTSAVDDDLRYGGLSRTEAAVDAWVDEGLILPERVSADLRKATEVIARETPAVTPGDVPQSPPGAAGVPPGDVPRRAPARQRQGGPGSAVEEARRIARKHPRGVPREVLLAAVRELLAEGKPATPYQVTKALPVGEVTAAKLLAEVAAERPPLTAISGRLAR